MSVPVEHPLGRMSKVEYETDTASKIESMPGSISIFDKYESGGKKLHSCDFFMDELYLRWKHCCVFFLLFIYEKKPNICFPILF